MSKDLPGIPDRVESELRRALVRMREELQSLLGTRGSDPAVRLTQFTGGAGGGSLVILPGTGTGGGSAYEPDLTPPPTPTFGSGDVLAGISQVIVTWAGINYTEGHGNKQTIVYAVQKDPSDATVPTFPGDAGIVAVAPHALTVIAIPSEPNMRWHVWLKFESVDGVMSTSPAGGTNGVTATTGQDVANLLEVLAGQITENELYSTLGTRINLIDGPNSDPTTVNGRIKAETDSRISAINDEISDRVAGDAATLSSAQTFTYSRATIDANIAASATVLQAAYTAADGVVYSNAQAYAQSWAYSRAQADSAISASSTTLTAAYQAADATVLSNADSAAAARDVTVLADAQAYTYARASIDGAIASSASTLTASFQAADAAVLADAQTYTNTYAFATSSGAALAGSVSTLQAQVAGTDGSYLKTAIENEAIARADETGDLFAQWTVKTDLNGYVSGFGLASTLNNATPFSEFAVRADRFYVGATSNYTSESAPVGASPDQRWFKPSTKEMKRWDGSAWVAFNQLPFVVQSSPTTINGVLIPPGVYIDAAYINNLTAMWARFGTLVADSIAAGQISASNLTLGTGTIGGPLKSSNYASGSAGWILNPNGTAQFPAAYILGQITASQINGTGLEIRESGTGRLLLGSGSSLPIDYAPAGTLNSAIPYGGNLVYNSDFRHGTDKWTHTDGYLINPTSWGVNYSGWQLLGSNTLYAYQSGRYGDPSAYFGFTSDFITVEAGKKYCASAYTGANRADAHIIILWFNTSVSYIGASTEDGPSFNSAEAAGGATLDGYKRIRSIGVAPAGAAYGRVLLRKYDTHVSQADSWMFVSQVQLEVIGADATDPGPWSPTGLMSKITPGNVSTYIDNVAINLAQINTASIGSLSALTATIGLLRSRSSGARTEIADDVIRVYDSSNVLRVKLGDLS